MAKAQRKQEAADAATEKERMELEAQRREEDRVKKERQNAAAVTIQSCARLLLAKDLVRGLRERSGAATVLQAHARGATQRRRYLQQREKTRQKAAAERHAELEKMEKEAALEAQRQRAKAEKLRENMRLEQALKDERARALQASREAEETAAAAAEAEQLQAVQDYAATVIQAQWRGHASRQQQFLDREIFGPAAVMIQALWRGYYVRKHFERIKAAALFDDDDDFDYDVEIDLDDLNFDENEFENEFDAVPPTPVPPTAANEHAGMSRFSIDGHTAHNSARPASAAAAAEHDRVVLKAPENLEPVVARPGVKEAWGASDPSRLRAPSPASLVTTEQARNIWSTTPTPDIMGYGSKAPSITPRPPSKQIIRIREEWGFKDPRTAELMAKRSKRMNRGAKSKRKKVGRPKKQPLSELLKLQKHGAGVAHQHSKFDSIPTNHGDSGTSRPGTRQGYQWTHDQHVMHRGLVSASGRPAKGSSGKGQPLRLPSISPNPSTMDGTPHPSTEDAVYVRLPEITGRSPTSGF